MIDGDSVPAALNDSPYDSFDGDSLLRVVNGDRELLRSLMVTLQTEWPRLLREMNQAAVHLDFTTLKRAVHTIRGGLDIFGFKLATQAADRIYDHAREFNELPVINLLPEFQNQIDGLLAGIQQWLDAN
jgi:HPt (histidine-containing phosphotransfer) domain-containing protein